MSAHPFLTTARRPALLSLLLVLLLGACGALPAAPGVEGAAPRLSLARSPRDVAGDFLRAWGRRDADAMFELIAPASRGLAPREAFAATYTDVNTRLGLDTVTYTITEATMQGASARVRYDLVLESSIFGAIEDQGRTMRLVNVPDEGWRVAWSSMDIFDGLTSTGRLTVEGNRTARANIYDRNGRLLVEQDGSVSVLFASKDRMTNQDACISYLANLLLLPRRALAARIQPFDANTVFYVGEIDTELEQGQRVNLGNLCGITREAQRVYTRTTRRYVGQGAAVHVTGLVASIPVEQADNYARQGYAADEQVGLASLGGVEVAYQDVLAGQPSRQLRILEGGGLEVRALAGAAGTAPEPVVLTIDRDLQLVTARALAEAYNAAERNWASLSPGAAVVVLDVNTGAVRALASYPTFQPGLFDSTNTYAIDRGQLLGAVVNDPRAPLVNRATREQYAPGSVFKIVTLAAVLEADLTEPDTPFDCQHTWDGRASYRDSTSPRSDWRLTDGLPPAGRLRATQALTASCNPFFWEFSARLYSEVGATALATVARDMGYDGATPMAAILPEASGTMPTPSSIEDALNHAIGQGDMQVSVLHTAKVVAAVANGGTLYQPYLVERVGGIDGAPISQQANPQPARTLNLSAETIAAVQRGMCDVPYDEALGTAFVVFGAVELYSLCGKTGTAEAGPIAPNAWFVAYTPRENPELAIVVFSQTSREGSEVAAPIARRILEGYYNLPYRSDWPDWWAGDFVPVPRPQGGSPGG